MDSATLLATARRSAGLSQRELATRARTSAAAVCLYESGERVPRVDTLARLLAAAGATLELRAAGSAIDPVANGRVLVDLLDLADRLPKRARGPLAAPVFANLARRPNRGRGDGL